ncbi:MAG: arsenite methyltransferase [Syntrophales bacterium LBB04]|nr:arsenite methyltransferase [Syntrophales bacterium LBB04]
MKQEEIKTAVRKGYAKIAQTAGSCCLPAASTCCGPEKGLEKISREIGYRSEDLQAVPDGANLGLGCGNPVALGSLQEGETVVDLGSGAGFDCFLAARAVGKNGKVIGVDMTPEMLDKARENIRKGDFPQVEFRLGEIENLPVADNTADIVISNCVINLSPDKERVFAEAFRVLKPGGRIMVSDIVLLEELPTPIKDSIAAYIGCVSGAVRKEGYLQALRTAGFMDVRIMDETKFPVKDLISHPAAKEASISRDTLEATVEQLSHSIASLKVYAVKPASSQVGTH